MENMMLEQAVQVQQVSNTFNIYGEITDKLALSFRDWANQILDTKTPQPVMLYINSPGGSVRSGIAMISAIEELQDNGVVVLAQIEGSCCSMAIPISVACDKRFAHSLTTFMIHGASGGTYDYISKSIKYLEFEKAQLTKLDAFISERTNITMKTLKKYEADELWFDYEEAIKLGVVTNDQYAEPEKSELEIMVDTLRSYTPSQIVEMLRIELDNTNDLISKHYILDNPTEADLTMNHMLEDRFEAIEAALKMVEKVSNINELDENYCVFIFNLIKMEVGDGRE